MNALPTDLLRQQFSYCPTTGQITRNGRPVGFKKDGYIRVGFAHEGKNFHLYVHRLALLLTNGNWPAEQVDHIDGDRSNNRLSNLREATKQQNLRNVPVRSHNKLGVKGVQKNKKGRFVARMTVDRKVVQIGVFRDVESARQAYLRKASEIHGEFLHSSQRETA